MKILYDIVVSLISGLFQATILWFFSWLARYLYTKTNHFTTKEFFLNRKVYLVGSVCIIIITASIFLFLVSSSVLNVNAKFFITCTSTLLLVFIFIKELKMYWDVGLYQITPTIAKDTYVRCFNSAKYSFSLIGTNAYSFVNLEEFELMIKRIKECSGTICLLLADPHSPALIEAALNRNCKDNLYQLQASIALGQLLNMIDKLGVAIDIKIYYAMTTNELPIFRSMFIDNHLSVASIAIYGRSDHGKDFPQIFATNDMKSPKSMYNVVYRYFLKIWCESKPLTEQQKEEYRLHFNMSLH